jgi:hypothetical protein
MGYIADHGAETGKLRFRLVYGAFSPTPLAYTDCDIPIVWDGKTFAPRGLAVSEIQNQASGSLCTMSIPDADNVVFGLLDASNGAEGIEIQVFTAEFSPSSSSAEPDDVVQTFSGAIETARKNTSGGQDVVEIWCGPPKQTSASVFPTRLINSLVRRKT